MWYMLSRACKIHLKCVCPLLYEFYFDKKTEKIFAMELFGIKLYTAFSPEKLSTVMILSFGTDR